VVKRSFEARVTGVRFPVVPTGLVMKLVSFYFCIVAFRIRVPANPRGHPPPLAHVVKLVDTLPLGGSAHCGIEVRVLL
jgi:hypothetical protein